jgi:hypothetical protein
VIASATEDPLGVALEIGAIGASSLRGIFMPRRALALAFAEDLARIAGEIAADSRP